MVNYIALAIPVFFLLIGVELLVARLQGKKLYRLNDSINDLACGTLQQLFQVFTKTLVFSAYVLLFQHTRLLELSPSSALTWVGCFLGVDFCYYWFHRISHESNLPWGAHIVHHSSEEFNLAVALRQGTFQSLFSWVFYLPLAWLGFPPLVFLTCSSFNTLYQFWIHTRAIKKLGPFEWVFNTPSHHRVHHGCDPKYIDRNYAGTLIVWDRLFGTFQEEEEEPTYGITRPLASWNPVWANVHYYVDLWRLSRQAPTLRDKVKVWLAPPAWKPEWGDEVLRVDHPTPLTHGPAGRYDARAPRGLGAYILVQYVGVVALTVLLLFRGQELTLAGRLGIAAAAAWTLINLGGLFESRRWVVISELARLGVFGLAAVALAANEPPTVLLAVATGAALICGLLAAWLLRRRPRPEEAASAYEDERRAVAAGGPVRVG